MRAARIAVQADFPRLWIHLRGSREKDAGMERLVVQTTGASGNYGNFGPTEAPPVKGRAAGQPIVLKPGEAFHLGTETETMVLAQSSKK